MRSRVTPDTEDKPLRPGSEEWVARNLKATEKWLQTERMLKGRAEGLTNDITKQQIVDQLTYADAHLKMVWPLATTQASATDRIPVSSTLLPVIFTYTGGGFGGALLRTPITCVGTTKWFAAAVMATDTQGFRILYHSMAPEEREIGIVPWELEPNGKYVLTYGPDVDEDEKMDSVTEQRDFAWPQTGTSIYIKVKPKTTYVVELNQTRRGRVPGKAPDPAISPPDIRYAPQRGLLSRSPGHRRLATIRSVGAADYRCAARRESDRGSVAEGQQARHSKRVASAISASLHAIGGSVLIS